MSAPRAATSRRARAPARSPRPRRRTSPSSRATAISLSRSHSPKRTRRRSIAAWIALEDISPESGPLAYVPGSQRFPFYDFSTPPGAAASHAPRGLHSGDYTYDPSRHTDADVAAAMAFYSAELERSGLPVHQFNASRGEVLIWHSALMHGGSAPVDEHRTRKSFVVHYL